LPIKIYCTQASTSTCTLKHSRKRKLPAQHHMPSPSAAPQALQLGQDVYM
jgi:hypothetical protein